jgi:hypothetical protein
MTGPASSPVGFINVAYAPTYERVYLAFIAGLAGFGLIPWLAVAAARLRNTGHRWFIFDTQPHRVAKALSDLGGVMVRVHNRSAESVLRCLVNALDREGPKPSLDDLKFIFTAVQRVAGNLKRDIGPNLFDTRPFGELAYVAAEAASRRVLHA